MQQFRPKQVGSGKKALNPDLGDWRRGVEEGARAKYQAERKARLAAYALRKSSGVSKYGSQMTFRKLFGTAQSDFSKFFKSTQEYREWKSRHGGISVRYATQDQASARVRDLHAAVKSAKQKFHAAGGDPRKHYNSAKSIKILMKRNGINIVSKAAINMIKMLDGKSGAALISWHKQKYGGRPNLPESEVMAFLKDQVVPYVQVAVEREEALQKKVQLSGKGGGAGSVGTQPDVTHWDRPPKPPGFVPRKGRPLYPAKRAIQPGYRPVPEPNYGTVSYEGGYDTYQRYPGGKMKNESYTQFEVPLEEYQDQDESMFENDSELKSLRQQLSVLQKTTARPTKISPGGAFARSKKTSGGRS